MITNEIKWLVSKAGTSDARSLDHQMEIGTFKSAHKVVPTPVDAVVAKQFTSKKFVGNAFNIFLRVICSNKRFYGNLKMLTERFPKNTL